MASKVKTGPKVLLVLALVGGAVFGARWYLLNHGDAKMQSAVPTKGEELVGFKEESTTNTPSATTAPGMPSTTVAKVDGPKVKMLVIPWNAQMGLALANGGPQTTQGSLMEKAGVNLTIERQDDYSKMQEELVSCANALKGGAKTCTKGANFVTIMGDAAPAFFAGLNNTLSKLGPEYTAEIVGSAGRSFGEDKFMAPQNVKDDPANGKGLLIAGVLKDGDWNIAMFWAAENEICNNPDVTTYDPNCLNWVGTSSFVEADEKYIQGACEDRPVVSNGKKTGETRNVCVQSVVTWTPGDVAVAKKKGGLVSVLSTKENGSQMANTIIGIKKWNQDNRTTVTSFLKAVFEGGDQVKRGGGPALKRAADASALIYKEETGAYWAKYYRGVEEEDAQGNLIHLGGSRVFNLADNLRYFGLEEGAANAYAATYKVFGDIAVQQYPADLPSYPPVESIFNPTFIQEVAASGAEKGKVDAPTFAEAPAVSETIAKKSWHISFDSGKATFSPTAAKDLKDLFSVLVVASDTIVEIHGHTDNVGSPDTNQALSQARAAAVKQFLESKAPSNFPEGRVQVFAHGQNQPVAPNTTPQGKAQNRRVDIVIKTNS
jgi:OmpA-OmpF porin, OOP family